MSTTHQPKSNTPYKPQRVRNIRGLVRAKLERASQDNTKAERLLGTSLGLAFARAIVGRDAL